MENNVSSAHAAPPWVRHPSVTCLIAKLEGRAIALPMHGRPQVRVDGRAVAEVRYVGADQTVGVHFPGEPLSQVWVFPRARVRIEWGGITLRSLEAYLATNPPIEADLDAPSELQLQPEAR